MRLLLFLLSIYMLISCSSNDLSKDFTCTNDSFSNLEELTDYKKNFTTEIPKNWKINYYYDDVVSSIYAADTTLSLTQTTLIDVSFVLSPQEIDDAFIKKIKADNTSMQLEEVTSKNTSLFSKSSYYNIAKGKKGKYNYKVLNVFTKTDLGFLHVKTEVYGDSLVDERICKAVKLIDKIELN